ncbi:MAG: UPF0104 family protein [Cytophagales bacterium]|nr:UPF0104 family protein [Rhizobacter sp.]
MHTRVAVDEPSRDASAAVSAAPRAVVAIVTLGAALGLTWWALHRQFGVVSWQGVKSALAAQPAIHIAAAVALTALSFLALAVYDLIGTRVAVGRRVPARTALFAGASANAISNTLGFHALTGSAVRARIYRGAGLAGADVARIVSLSWLSLALGFLAMLCVAAWVQAAVGSTPAASLQWGLGLAALLLLLIAWLAAGQRQLVVFRFRQPLPSARMALALMATGAVESAAAIGALYVLLPADLAPSFSLFAIGCIGAVALGLVAHAPGGIGVFEASVTALLSGAGRADLLAALLLYRAVYNLLPFALAITALAWHARSQRSSLSSTAGSG